MAEHHTQGSIQLAAVGWGLVKSAGFEDGPLRGRVLSPHGDATQRGWITGDFAKCQMDAKFRRGGWKATRRRCIGTTSPRSSAGLPMQGFVLQREGYDVETT